MKGNGNKISNHVRQEYHHPHLHGWTILGQAAMVCVGNKIKKKYSQYSVEWKELDWPLT